MRSPRFFLVRQVLPLDPSSLADARAGFSIVSETYRNVSVGFKSVRFNAPRILLGDPSSLADLGAGFSITP